MAKNNNYYCTYENKKQWESLRANEPVEISKDGVLIITVSNPNEAFKYILDHYSMSVAWTTAYDGIRVKTA